MIHFFKYGLIGGLLLAGAACDAPTGGSAATGVQVGIGQISFIESSQLKIRSNIQLDQKARADFESFKAAQNAHGAFYVGSNGSGSAGHLNAATGADAQKTAKVLCEHFAKRTCVLYATVEPGPNDDPNALPRLYKKEIQPAVRGNQVVSKLAVAVSPIGSFGYAWNFDTRSNAQEAAIESCKKAVARGSAKNDETLRAVLQNAGLHECRIHIYY